MIDIVSEYKELLEKKYKYETELSKMPKGSLSYKTINGKKYCYLQCKSGGKVSSEYIASESVSNIKSQLALRRQYETEIPKIKQRLCELEQAAKLISNETDRTLTILKISIGMDDLSVEQKEKSISFANAMNAIEGVPVSSKTAEEITAWKNGSKSFLSVFLDTLQRYEIPVEV